ncbi:TPA: hypothetical protein P0E05_003885 [Vibrio fluvialis]|nr:hypothetical protein [Vibrio fluvialis]
MRIRNGSLKFNHNISLGGEDEIYVDGVKVDYDINSNVKNISNLLSLRFADKLKKEPQSDTLWLSRYIERNTLHSSFFEDLCFAVIVNKIYSENKKNKVEVITNRSSVYEYYSNFLNQNIELFYFFKVFLNKTKHGLYNIYFAFNFIKNSFFLHRSRKRKKIKPGSYVIQTWVTEPPRNDEKIRDIYYHDLASYFHVNKVDYCYWYMPYNVSCYGRMLKRIEKNHNIFFLYDFTQLRDLYKAYNFYRKRKQLLKDVNWGEIEGIDLNCFSRFFSRKELLEESDLVYQVFKRLELKDCKFIVNHENMIVEKALILAIDNENNKVFGNFHTSMPDAILCLDYHTKEEFLTSPKPHRILFNSVDYRKYFEDNFFCKDIEYVDGYAFKQSVHKETKPDKIYNNEVLVILPGNRDEALNIINMFKSGRRDTQNIKFRCHPMVPMENCFDCESSIDKNESLSESLKKYRIVISGYSGAALEAALLGCSVGLLYDKKKLMFNPMDKVKNVRYRKLATSEDISKFIEDEQQAGSCLTGIANSHFYNLESKSLNNYL